MKKKNHPLQKKLNEIPHSPGVYFFKDLTGKIIYIGKAKNLYSRVRSYFLKGIQNFKTQILNRSISDFSVTLTNSEEEAFLLENTLVKKHQPHFNILLKDGKSFPYLKLTLGEEFPRLLFTRKIQKDGSRYFGPYVYIHSLRKFQVLLQKIFKLRTCQPLDKKRPHPCLEYDLGRCSAPCTQLILEKSYGVEVQKLESILKGNISEIKVEVDHEMKKCSQKFDFESAADWRNLLFSLEGLVRKQNMVIPGLEDCDVFFPLFENKRGLISLFCFRDGALTGHLQEVFDNLEDTHLEVLLMNFIEAHYLVKNHPLPESILIPKIYPGVSLLEESLNRGVGGKVFIKEPKKGKKLEFLKLLEKNARAFFQRDRGRARNISLEFQKIFENLKKVTTIEGFDISHLQGRATFCSLIRWVEGRCLSAGYRLFEVKGVKPGDDYGALSQALSRRMTRLKTMDPQLWPDLFLIDGGKGQVSAVTQALEKFAGPTPFVVGLAKREERIYFKEGPPEGIKLPLDHPVLRELISIRDEAHRFSNTHSGKKRIKMDFENPFEEIPGIGKNRGRELSSHFSNMKNLKRVESLEELHEKTKFPLAVCRKIFEFLKR